MQKRGQVTIFIVIGIILLAVVGAFLYFSSEEATNNLEPQSQASELSATSSSVKTFVQDCISDTSVPALYLVAGQGGIIYPQNPDNLLLTQEKRVGFSYKNKQLYLTKENVQRELERYLDENILECFDFTEFRDRGIEIELLESPRAQVDLERDEVFITITAPLKIEQAGTLSTLESFQTSLKIRLAHLIDITQELVQEYEQNPQNVDLSLLSSYDVLINVYPFDEQTLIYEISDPQSNFKNIPYIFYTAMREEDINSAPILEFIPAITLVKNKPFQGQVIAQDPNLDKLTYSSSLSWLHIDSQGVLTARPTKSGTFKSTITITDPQGASDSQEVSITVR